METRFRSLPAIYSTNGIREDHSPKSVLFQTCDSETCKGESREFQIKSIDAGKRIRVFRCVICGIELIKEDSARAESNKKKE